jgi:putative ABC transport system permease protein
MRRALAQGTGLAMAGVAIGVVGALSVTRLLQTLLSQVAAVLIGVASVASNLPARRAAAVDPMVALRYV